MTTTARRRAGWVWPLAVAGIAIIAVCAVAAIRPWADDRTAIAAAGDDALGAVSPAPLSLSEHPRVLIFGDSWTYGSAAFPPSLGYAFVLSEQMGWESTVDGVRGSGYLKPGLDGGAYGERIAALDPTLDPELVIVQGSINDRRLPAAGYDDAVTAAWDSLAARYPAATIIILGPAPQVLPVESATRRIDADLSALAAARGWWYISPIAEQWITPENYLEVIDTASLNHPSNNGHAYLAARLAEALAAISDGQDASADAPADGAPGEY